MEDYNSKQLMISSQDSELHVSRINVEENKNILALIDIKNIIFSAIKFKTITELLIIDSCINRCSELVNFLECNPQIKKLHLYSKNHEHNICSDIIDIIEKNKLCSFTYNIKIHLPRIPKVSTINIIDVDQKNIDLLSDVKHYIFDTVKLYGIPRSEEVKTLPPMLKIKKLHTNFLVIVGQLILESFMKHDIIVHNNILMI